MHQTKQSYRLKQSGCINDNNYILFSLTVLWCQAWNLWSSLTRGNTKCPALYKSCHRPKILSAHLSNPREFRNWFWGQQNFVSHQNGIYYSCIQICWHWNTGAGGTLFWGVFFRYKCLEIKLWIHFHTTLMLFEGSCACSPAQRTMS